MFDPKPALMKYDGKPAPFEIKGRALNGSQQIMASPWKFTDAARADARSRTCCRISRRWWTR